jgi:predicted aconitase with swiveling domain
MSAAVTTLKGEVLIPGSADAPVLRLAKQISFWGGVDPFSGRITDPRHPDHDAVIGGKVLVLPGTIGSSSSSAVMLELMASGKAPAALVLAEPDAILVLGVVVAREMGYGSIPALIVPRAAQDAFAHATRAAIAEDGSISVS